MPIRGKRRVVIISAVAALAVAGAATGAWWVLFAHRPPDPAKATQRQVLEYMASDAFGRQSDAKRLEYFEKVRRQVGDDRGILKQAGELSDAQRKQLRENTAVGFEKAGMEQIEAYLKLPPEDRTARLDKILDMVQAMRVIQRGREMVSSAVGGSSAPRPANRGFAPNLTPERLRNLIEKHDPVTRAKFASFIMDLQARARQRGIELPG